MLPLLCPLSGTVLLLRLLFCAFFPLDFGNLHLLPPPRVPPFPTPSTALVLWIHLTSCGKSYFNHASQNNTPHVRRISPGTRIFLLTIYPPWLLNMFPYSYWASTCMAALPTYSAFMISVRQASDLPPASFRFPVTQDTLALGYILPAVGRIRGFHSLKHAPAGRTIKKRSGTFLSTRSC